MLATTDGPQELHGRKLALVFSGLLLVMLMAALDSTIVATALPTIASATTAVGPGSTPALGR